MFSFFLNEVLTSMKGLTVKPFLSFNFGGLNQERPNQESNDIWNGQRMALNRQCGFTALICKCLLLNYCGLKSRLVEQTTCPDFVLSEKVFALEVRIGEITVPNSFLQSHG